MKPVLACLLSGSLSVHVLNSLCTVSTGTDPTILGSVAKVVESGEKARENGGSVMKSRQDGKVTDRS